MNVCITTQTTDKEPILVGAYGAYSVPIQLAGTPSVFMGKDVSMIKVIATQAVIMSVCEAGQGLPEKQALVENWNNEALHRLAKHFSSQITLHEDASE